jgi:hypothetical protein
LQGVDILQIIATNRRRIRANSRAGRIAGAHRRLYGFVLKRRASAKNTDGVGIILIKAMTSTRMKVSSTGKHIRKNKRKNHQTGKNKKQMFG